MVYCRLTTCSSRSFFIFLLLFPAPSFLFGSKWIHISFKPFFMPTISINVLKRFFVSVFVVSSAPPSFPLNNDTQQNPIFFFFYYCKTREVSLINGRLFYVKMYDANSENSILIQYNLVGLWSLRWARFM